VVEDCTFSDYSEVGDFSYSAIMFAFGYTELMNGNSFFCNSAYRGAACYAFYVTADSNTFQENRSLRTSKTVLCRLCELFS
jgi:hypothetical protein